MMRMQFEFQIPGWSWHVKIEKNHLWIVNVNVNHWGKNKHWLSITVYNYTLKMHQARFARSTIAALSYLMFLLSDFGVKFLSFDV